MALTRRDALKVGALGALTAAAGCSSDDSGGGGEGGDNLPVYEHDGELGPETLFNHGVASGDPLADAVIIWTRVSPDSDGSVEVWWEIATDPEFTKRVQVGTVSTDASRDYTVKHDVTGLSAGSTYYYRFFALGRESLTGRTKTAPAAGSDLSRMRIGVCSCSSYAHGYFHAYAAMAERSDLDLVLHLGDYIYEYGTGEYGDVREYEPAHEIVTLEDYRMRYSQYRRDPELQAVHRQFAFINVWDDHETTNNSYKDGAENHQPETEGDWEERKAAAIQAYFEWLPIRESSDGHIWRSFAFGNLIDLVMLDTRIWGRDEPRDGLTGEVPPDPEGRTILGEDQATWMEDQLKTSQTAWRVVGQQVMMAHLKSVGKPNSEGGGSVLNFDQWHAYPNSQLRFFNLLGDTPITNVVVLTGDIHNSWAAELTPDPNNPDAYDGETGEGSVAVEFVTPGITSPGFPPGLDGIVASAAPENPHIKWWNLEDRGYIVLDITPERVQAAWYHHPVVTDPDNANEVPGAVYATYAGENRLVEDGPAASAPEDAAAPAP